MAENLVLLVVGILAGLAAAMLAVAPHLATRPGSLPWASLCTMLAAVFVTGVVAGFVAIASALRAPLLPALRSE